MIDGVMEHGAPGALPPPEVPGREVLTEEIADDKFDFGADLVKDERDRQLVEIAARQGQDRFRLTLLDAYGETCAVTGYEAAETLEAAHIFPYRGPAAHHVRNGLLLRADIHTLFDRGTISVHEDTYRVLVKPHLMVTRYAGLAECTLRPPKRRDHRPSTVALRSHREW